MDVRIAARLSTTEHPGGGAGAWAGRQTPWSNEAEQAVLGAMLLDQDAALKAAEILDDTMFYRRVIACCSGRCSR